MCVQLLGVMSVVGGWALGLRCLRGNWTVLPAICVEVLWLMAAHDKLSPPIQKRETKLILITSHRRPKPQTLGKQTPTSRIPANLVIQKPVFDD